MLIEFRLAGALALAMLSGSVFGQKTATVTLPAEGDYVAFAAKGLPTSAPVDVVKASAGVAVVSLATGQDHVFAWDRHSGNLAMQTADAAVKGWAPKPADFNLVAQTQVALEHDGKPLSAASVDVDDGKRKSSTILDPSMKGTAEFFALHPGTVKVSVLYRSGGANAKPLVQIFDLKLDRSEPIPQWKVAVADPVQTLDATGGAAAPATSAPAEKPAAPPTPRANPIGLLLVYLVGIAAAVGVGYALLKTMRDNSALVSEKLERLGVQIPKPADAPLTDPGNLAAPIAPKPEPIQKIMLADAQPDPVATPLMSAPAVSVAGPSLVAESGGVVPITEGESVVGRELGIALSLPSETTVSRRHAKLTKTGDQVMLDDLGSTNGTFVNGAKVSGPTMLRPGDSVQFGSVKFRYEA